MIIINMRAMLVVFLLGSLFLTQAFAEPARVDKRPITITVNANTTTTFVSNNITQIIGNSSFQCSAGQVLNNASIISGSITGVCVTDATGNGTTNGTATTSLPASNISSGTFGSNTGNGNYIFPQNLTIRNQTFLELIGQCEGSNVLATDSTGRIFCDTDNSNPSTTTLPIANISSGTAQGGTYTFPSLAWGSLVASNGTNITGVTAINSILFGGQITSFFYNTSVALQPLLNGISVIGANVTGDLSSFNNKITLLAGNITGDLSFFNNKIKLDYSNLTNTPTIPNQAGVTIPANNVTGGLFAQHYNFTGLLGWSNLLTSNGTNITGVNALRLNGQLSSFYLDQSNTTICTSANGLCASALPSEGTFTRLNVTTLLNISGDFRGNLSNATFPTADNFASGMTLVQNVSMSVSGIVGVDYFTLPPYTTSLPASNITSGNFPTGNYGFTGNLTFTDNGIQTCPIRHIGSQQNFTFCLNETGQGEFRIGTFVI